MQYLPELEKQGDDSRSSLEMHNPIRESGDTGVWRLEDEEAIRVLLYPKMVSPFRPIRRHLT